MSQRFVHLHTHSHYSLLDGLPKIDDLVRFAKTQGFESLALTDHGTLYGAIEFYQRAKTAGIKPIIGVETYIAPNGLANKRAKIDEQNFHLVLLAQNYQGYLNLIKLVTVAHLQGYYYKPRVDYELLKQHAQGLIAMSACLKGEVAQAVRNHSLDHAEAVVRRYQEIFGKDNFFLELQPHAHTDQQNLNQSLIALHQRTGAELVATADSHYLRPEDAEAQDILLCIQMKKQLSDPNRMSMAGQDLALKTAEEMAALFPDHPEALTNTVAIADRCNVEIPLGAIQLPHYEVPTGRTAEQYVRQLCVEGIPRRYGQTNAEIEKRLDYELSVITKTGFAPYFLIVQDLVNWAKAQGIVVGPGRGSAAGSIVSYLLNITNVDPIKYDLLFERFLNPERISPPDIDIDFADTRRDEVLRYVESKYGQDRVAQIITFGTMAARAAIRDVGRVLGLPYAYCDRVAKLIPLFSSLDQALKQVPELKEIYDNDADGRRLIEGAKKLEGVARHASRHACGVVITKDPLEKHVPLQYASPDDNAVISQFSLHPIEDLGLLKMDFLGLSNLTILETCINLVEKTRGQNIKLDDIPFDNRSTFRLLQRGETTGVFQLESGGMRRYLRELKPTSLEDIIAMVALYRPGPMELIPQFIAGKHGKNKPDYLDARLEPILNKTYGVAVYQEQVMQIARDIAGFSLGEADVLRKAVGKKISSLLKEQRERFVAGAIQNGTKPKVAEKLFDFIEPFARYGFNRSHAACYAVIAYHTAFCKANFPTEFMAALLTSDHHNTDRIALEIDEARRMGITVLPPDVNESFASFTVVIPDQGQPNTIRFGLGAVKNVGDNLVTAIISERKQNGSFQSLEDFLRRVQHKDLNKKSMESLAKVGAFDQFIERQQLLENMDDLLKFAKKIDTAASHGQSSLFGSLPAVHAPGLRLRVAAAATSAQRGQWEKQLLGLYITDHPLQAIRQQLEQRASTVVAAREHGRGKIKVGGLITNVKRILTKTNQRMAFVRLEDLSGSMEVVVFPNLFQESGLLWQEDRIVIVDGQLSNKDGEWKLLADRATEFQPGTTPVSSVLKLAIQMEQTSPGAWRELKTLLEATTGEQRVELHVRRGADVRIIPTEHRITLTPQLREALRQLLGNCIIE